MTIEQQIFEARIDSALNEALAGLDKREVEIEERKQVFIQRSIAERDRIEALDTSQYRHLKGRVA